MMQITITSTIGNCLSIVKKTIDTALLSQEEHDQLFKMLNREFLAKPSLPDGSQPKSSMLEIKMEHVIRLPEADLPDDLKPLIYWLLNPETVHD
jgi:hypothetical protein